LLDIIEEIIKIWLVNLAKLSPFYFLSDFPNIHFFLERSSEEIFISGVL